MSSIHRFFFSANQFGLSLSIAASTMLFAEQEITPEFQSYEMQSYETPAYECCTLQNLNYQLYDLGEIDLSLETSNKELRPRLNNIGQAIGNRKEGGFEWNQCSGEFAPYIHDVVIQFHSISNRGDLLISLTRPGGAIEWAIWPTADGTGARRETILTPEINGCEFAFNDINDDRLVAGYFINKDGRQQMVIWEPECGLRFPSSADGTPLQGVYKGMSGNGTLYGYFLNGSELRPSTWNLSRGETFLNNYRSKVLPDGAVNLDEIAMTDDGVVYGSYSIDYPQPTDNKLYYVYAWKPATGGFKLIDVDGMRATVANNLHVLAGDLDGKPSICLPGQTPKALADLLPKSQKDKWEINSITAINDSCHLTGIATYEDKPRAFFAERLSR